jgi:hypothetical protein
MLRILKLRLRYLRRAAAAFFGFCPECGASLVFDRDYSDVLVPRGWCPRCQTVKP